jgi:hypothetical protein
LVFNIVPYVCSNFRSFAFCFINQFTNEVPRLFLHGFRNFGSHITDVIFKDQFKSKKRALTETIVDIRKEYIEPINDKEKEPKETIDDIRKELREIINSNKQKDRIIDTKDDSTKLTEKSTEQTQKQGLTDGAIAGIVIGSVCFLGVVAGLVYWFLNEEKNRENNNTENLV